MSILSIYLSGLTLAMSASHAPTLNAALDGVPAAAVSFSDLNLASPGGRLALQGRVNRAASRLCDTAGPKSLDERASEIRCMSATLSEVQGDIDQAVRLASR